MPERAIVVAAGLDRGRAVAVSRAKKSPAVDGGESVGWRQAEREARAAKKRGNAPAAPPPVRKRRFAIKVQESDLDDLEAIKTLLFALNDAYADTSKIEKLVENIPVLHARCMRRARDRQATLGQDELAKALTPIGNMGLETELLLLLEDLTIMRCELEDAEEG